MNYINNCSLTHLLLLLHCANLSVPVDSPLLTKEKQIIERVGRFISLSARDNNIVAVGRCSSKEEII